MKTPDQIRSDLSAASTARDAAMATLGEAKTALGTLSDANDLASQAGTDEEKAAAAAALSAGQDAFANAERAVQQADAEIQGLNRLLEIAEETALHEQKLRDQKKRAEEAPAAAAVEEAAPKYTKEELAEEWLLQSTSQYRVNHPDGTVFGMAGSEPHKADAWIREQVDAKLLKKTGMVR